MPELGRTWMVLLRNVSHAVRVVGEDQLMAALALHAETGLVLGVSIQGTAAEALAGALLGPLSRCDGAAGAALARARARARGSTGSDAERHLAADARSAGGNAAGIHRQGVALWLAG